MKGVLLVLLFTAAGCAHDARFAGTWYRPIPLTLRLEPNGAATFDAPRNPSQRRPLARGTWTESDGQLLVVIPPGGCLGTPNARAGFFSLRFIDGHGAPARLRVELVSLDDCRPLAAVVAEEYVAVP